MRKVIFAVCIVGVTTFSMLAQQKYLVYFKDKGIPKQAVLQKNSASYALALQSISERSIQRRKKYLGEEKFITYEDVPIHQPYLEQIEKSGAKIWNKLKWFNAVSVYADENQIAKISSLPFVEKVDAVKTLSYQNENVKESPENALAKSAAPTSSLAYNYGASYGQYALSDIPQVHAKGITGDGVIIGILDSGFRWKLHESLASRKVLAEYDFVFHDTITANESNDVSGQDGHGTSVFSILGGFKEGSIVAPAFNASFLLAKTEDIRTETHIEEDNYAAALQWMDSIGVDITTSSLGYNEFDPATFSYTYADMNGTTAVVTKAAELAFTQFGISTFTSAGNDGNYSWHYIGAPADAVSIMAVGAVSNSNIKASFSSFGPTSDGRIKPEIVAQGVSVYGASASSSANNLYGFGSGTSDACPIAAGIAAQLLSLYPHLTNVQIRTILLATSGNAASPNNDIGYGLISSLKAITYPNLEKTGLTYTLNKCFEIENILPESVLLHLVNGVQTIEQPMNKGQKGIYTSPLSSYNKGDALEFYVTYSDSNLTAYREPMVGKFSLTSIKDVAPPAPYGLEQNYPNPFNPTTQIWYSIQNRQFVSLKVYDLLGNEVSTLVNEEKTPGMYRVEFRSIVDNKQLASGVYFYVLKAGGKLETKKMLLLK